MVMNGFTRNFEPLEIISAEQLESIHWAALGILQNTGVRFENEKALQFLDRNHCQVDFNSMRVRMQPGLVEDCLRKVPSSFRIKARDTQNDLQMGGNALYFTTFAGMETVDIQNWKARAPTKDEFYQGVAILDALENLHYLQSYSPWYGFKEVPPVMAILEGAAAKARCSSKSQKEGSTHGCYKFILQMAKAIGSDIGLSVAPSPPMTFSSEAIDVAFDAVEGDCYVMIVASGLMGSSAPVTIAGASVTGIVEVLAGVVLCQLIKPGTPIIVGTMAFPQNMASGSPAFGSIESSLQAGLFAQYFRQYKIPTQLGAGGVSNAKSIDFQCGYEKSITALLAALFGYNSISLHGGIYGELTAHPLQAILDDDIAGMIGRFLEGVEVNDETIAMDLIANVGPIPGFYLDKDHTRQWWRKEQYLPKSADRLTYPEWMESGQKSALDYAQIRMDEIVANHKPMPLSAAMDADLERILNDARGYYGKKGLI